MHIEIEREIHNLTLEAIIHGRRLADEWLAAGCIPKGTTKRLILETLEQLRERQGFDGATEDFIEMMGNEIRRALNEYRDGIGDRAISGDVDTVWEQDKDVIKLVNLACRWKAFRAAKRAVDDQLAAVRQMELMLSGMF